MAGWAAWFASLSLLLWPAIGAAGPPFVTDDPEPVDFKHFEIYLASASLWDDKGWSGTAPHLEINYGALPQLQLHLIVPAAFAAPANAASHYGLGDIEVGAKLRFVLESKWVPQIGTFLLVEVPSGDGTKSLGNGQAQLSWPLWVQKSFGPWTTYGGFGYWFNGLGSYRFSPELAHQNRGFWFFGWQVQRRLSAKAALGAELFHLTARTRDSSDETRFNLGLMVDFSQFHHILVSAGRGLQGPIRFQSYLAYQITFGLPQKSRK